jgi:hypothetical protein
MSGGLVVPRSLHRSLRRSEALWAPHFSSTTFTSWQSVGLSRPPNALAHLEIQEDSGFFRGGLGCPVPKSCLSESPASWNN